MMRINCVLAMHKILTVWTKFLYSFILWMLLSKSDFLNETNDYNVQNGNYYMQMNSGYSSVSILYNDSASSIVKLLNKKLPKDLVSKKDVAAGYMQYSERNNRKLYQLVEPSSIQTGLGYFIPGAALFHISFATFASAASQRLPELTTEYGIFTGIPNPTPKPSAPLEEFEVSVNETFGTFMNMRISWNATFNITKVELRFENPNPGKIKHHIEFPPDFLRAVKKKFPPESGRIGFVHKVGGLTKSQRYYLTALGYAEDLTEPLIDKLSFLTSDKDTDDLIYDLNGIFMVLGISTILMLFVMCCVGYEKLIHKKKSEAIDIICCRRKNTKNNRIHDSSIDPEPLNRSYDVPGLPGPEEEYVKSGPSRALAF